MRQRFFSLLLSFGLGALLTACSPPQEDQKAAPIKPLQVIVIGTADTADPHRARSQPDRLLAAETSLSLLSINAAGQLVPGLAESWRISDDGLKAIFRLRPARWEDGRPVTSADVVASFQRIFTPANIPDIAQDLAAISGAADILAGKAPVSTLGVRALTEEVLEVQLSSAKPSLLALFADPRTAIVRAKRTERKSRAAPILLGLGPYIAHGGDSHARQLIARINAPLPAPQRPPVVVLRPQATNAPAIAAFRAGKADIVLGDILTDLGTVRTLPDQTVVRLDPLIGVYGFIANTRQGPLQDVRLRRALAMSVDRPALIKALFKATPLEPVTGLVPPRLVSYGPPPQPDWMAWDSEQRMTEAARLVREGGFGPAHPLPLTLLLRPGAEDAAVAAALAKSWAPLGVVIQTRVTPPLAMTATLHSGAFDLAVWILVREGDMPATFLRDFGCQQPAATNPGGYCNTEADSLHAQALKALDVTSRIRHLRQAEKLMIDEAPMISLFTPVRWSLVHPDLEGWINNPLGRHPLSALRWTQSEH